ncbi:HNH endonuclease signature motif containing protein [Methylobrevis albus]|uniref:HNH endonuclease n=1 Tax=Methylobrevis albus TaxID=2793297 RepID=A0A931I402_9HYPH|nr:HNH endonuclease signature motif containing protein [Methylobrevis albus]MBH0238476.1 HNH endonuclease [Methylobrevis albus]
MTSRTIPEPVQRQVRQDCGFGCVICGAPIFTYDHIDEFSITQSHESSNIALLCYNHHMEKTAKRLSKDVVKKYRASPHNKMRKSKGIHTWILQGNSVEFRIGNNVFGSPAMSDGEKYVAINFMEMEIFSVRREGDNLLVSIFINDIEGNQVLKIIDNEMILGENLWDFDFSGTRMKIRSLSNPKRVINFEFNPNTSVIYISESRFRIDYPRFAALNPFENYREIRIEKDLTVILPSNTIISGFHCYVGRIGMRIV